MQSIVSRRARARTSHADYALMLENKPVVFVEAKAFDNVLTAKHARQAISYGKVEDVQWVVLTNGRTLKIFDTSQGKTEKECIVVEIDLTKLLIQAEDLNLISRSSILSGDIKEAIKRLAATRKAIRNLSQQQGQIADEFRKILVKITGKKVKNRIQNISIKLAEQAVQLFERQSEAVVIEIPMKGVPRIRKEQLASKPPGRVVVCPSKDAGVEFLKKYNAWGFVNLREENIPYFALYVGRPKSSVLYFGEVETITKPLKSKEDLVKIKKEDIETFKPGKRVIHLKPGSLAELLNPIALEDSRRAPRGLVFTTLEKFAKASYISDLRPTPQDHFNSIKNTLMREMALKLRSAILRLSESIRETTTQECIVFSIKKNFAKLYIQDQGFWLLVKIPRNQFNLPNLDIRPHEEKAWTHIRVDRQTDLKLLIEAARLAYESES